MCLPSCGYKCSVSFPPGAMRWSVVLSFPGHIHFIGVAPITQITHVRNRNSNIQGRSPNVKILLPFPLREVPILKRDAIKRITACSSSLPLMCVTFSSFRLSHCACFMSLILFIVS